MFIKPARQGLNVPFPDQPRRFLSADGEDVLPTTYWIRRKNAGEVVLAQKPLTPKRSATK